MVQSYTSADRPQVDFLGIPLDNCTLDQALMRAERAMSGRERLQHGDVNVAKFIAFRTDDELRRCTVQSDIVCADGMGIVWGCRMLGLPLTERVTGIDLMLGVLDSCNRLNLRPYFLGARQDVLEDAVAKVRQRYPQIQVAGWRNGYFQSDQEQDIVASINASGADCLFVGIASPLKERFLNRHRDTLAVPVQLGVGGAFDVLSGHIRRAPPWMQTWGLEWLWRLLQEPRRLWRRYLVTNLTYFAILSAAMLRRIAGRPHSASGASALK